MYKKFTVQRPITLQETFTLEITDELIQEFCDLKYPTIGLEYAKLIFDFKTGHSDHETSFRNRFFDFLEEKALKTIPVVTKVEYLENHSGYED